MIFVFGKKPRQQIKEKECFKRERIRKRNFSKLVLYIEGRMNQKNEICYKGNLFKKNFKIYKKLKIYFN